MTYHILVVDDIFVNRLLLTEILKKIPATYAQADNGKKAIELLSKEKFDAIFMDIEMPVMNGLETTRYIREKLPSPINKIPIIALTAHNPQNFFSDFEDAGFDELITKPYSIEKIARVVESICNLTKSI
ncbi:response regulator [Williamwhitmania taraxaci]|uniref:CheY chemotaxis protein or a CheY-like REC (Receiver) domain n=1 Tax=Williamwhitmania taraxaci TaxID=1640674 RepID=A0A1G6Q3P3_9BACT|nr:response regulator [Williamwhitmania taraxaci]SDC86257.1 CheY chemotaxis protein or a CheY-like REC (receiver) domain [Williamwhitmania taraxaci]